MAALLFTGDLAFVQAIHGELDAVALSAGYQISMNGKLTAEIKEFVLKEAGAEISVEEPYEGRLGESLNFVVSKTYQSLIISSEPLVISVRRSAVIGYYA